METAHNSEQSSATIDEKFRAAVDIVQSLPKDGPVVTTTEEKLAFYSLYKQATVGPCNTSQPSFWNVVEKIKWEAWKKLGCMEPSEAKAIYIRRISCKIMDVSEEHDAEEWVRDEQDDKLMQKFAILGLQLRRSKRADATAVGKESEELLHPDVTNEEEDSDTRSQSSSTSKNATSDMDYMDCDEDERYSSASRSAELTLPRDGVESRLRLYTNKIEDELKVISRQISSLAVASKKQHSLMMDALNKAVFYMFIPKISWKTIFILIIWPFLANMLVRILKNVVGL